VTGFSHEISGSGHQLQLAYNVGDYVTAVYLKPYWKRTLRLYGLLGLRRDVGFVTPDRSSRIWSNLKLMGLMGSIGLGFFVAGWNVYALGRYSPIDWNWQHGLTIGIGAILIGVPVLYWMSRHSNRHTLDRKILNSPASPETKPSLICRITRFSLLGQNWLTSMILTFGGLLLGGVTFFCWTVSINALFDRSASQDRLVKIRGLWVQTHNFIIRDYQIEYEFTDDITHKKQQLMSTPWHMHALRDADTGVAKVRAGYFGWKWVETINARHDNQDAPHLDEPLNPGEEIAWIN
jgi:hypothetical protein